MKTKVAINGFGRIGRQVLKRLLEDASDTLEVVAINDLFDPKTNAHLFKYDSNYGIYNGEVTVSEAGNLVIDGTEIKVLAERDPATCPGKNSALISFLNAPAFSPLPRAKVARSALMRTSSALERRKSSFLHLQKAKI